MTTGLQGRAETIVSDANTAQALGSGTVPVFATPMLVALMEAAAMDALRGQLEEGQTTVGTYIATTHQRATPVGRKVWAQAQLVETDRRALTFTVTAYDDKGVVGEGTHKRFIVEPERFLKKVQE